MSVEIDPDPGLLRNSGLEWNNVLATSVVFQAHQYGALNAVKLQIRRLDVMTDTEYGTTVEVIGRSAVRQGGGGESSDRPTATCSVLWAIYGHGLTTLIKSTNF